MGRDTGAEETFPRIGRACPADPHPAPTLLKSRGGPVRELQSPGLISPDPARMIESIAAVAGWALASASRRSPRIPVNHLPGLTMDKKE